MLQEENHKLQKRLQLQQELPDAEAEGESPEQRQRYKQVIQKLAANNEEIYKVGVGGGGVWRSRGGGGREPGLGMWTLTIYVCMVDVGWSDCVCASASSERTRM